MKCDKEKTQEECLSSLLSLAAYEDSIRVIHNLAAIHAYSIEVDDKTRDTLFAGSFELHRDFVRHPLVMDGSMEHRRDLEDANAGQQIPWGVEFIRAMGVWDEFGVRGEGVKVCILDTGVDASHEDFTDLNLSGYSGDESMAPWDEYSNRGHGTHILGTIAASDNDIGIVGVTPDVEAFIVRVFDDEGDFDDFRRGGMYSSDLIAAAMICADHGANIISASLGGSIYNQDEDEFFRFLRESYSIITVAAAGNNGDDRNVYPASYDSVLSVGASNRENTLADFSTLNAFTDVLAPGVAITSTYPDNNYLSFSGTSMAAPFAAGTLALLLNYKNIFKPEATIEMVLDSLKATVAWGGSAASDRDGDFSHIGIIDAYSAILYLNNYELMQSQISDSMNNDNELECSNEVRLELATDSRGAEIAYRLRRESDKKDIWVQLPGTLKDNEKYSLSSCLDLDANDCFRFDVRDTGGDGIEGIGLDLFFRGHELYHGGNFGSGGSLTFGDNC